MKRVAVEVAVGTLERRVLGDFGGNAVVGHAEPVLARRVVDRCVQEDGGEYLLGIDLLAGALGTPLRVLRRGWRIPAS